MKLNISASALLFGAMLFSCTVEIDTPEVEDTKVNDYVITAYSEGSATKAELSSDNYVLWQKDDKISVLSMVDGVSPANDLFTLESGEQTTSGTFRGSLSNPELSHVGVYPYNNNHMYGAIGSLSWGKDVQIATKDDFDPEAFLMAGQMDADGKISFKNICSYIKFTTDFACESIEISSNSNPDNSDIKHLVSDIVSFTFDENGDPVAISAVEGFGLKYDKVTLVGQYDEEGHSKLIPAGTYYVAVLPQEYYGLTFTFNTEFGKTIEKSTKSGAQIKIERNHIANVGTFPLDKLLPAGTSGFYGSGTESDPYLISSLSKLQKFAEIFSDPDGPGDFAGKYFRQTTDIDCQGKEISIGSERQDGDDSGAFDKNTRMFSGVYDGGGYTISNYKMKPWSTSVAYYAGLFYQVYQGTIQNLNIRPAVGKNNEIVDITSGDNSKEIVVGALIAKSGAQTPNLSGDKGDVTVTNCHLLGQEYRISGSRSTVFGGLIGWNVAENLTMVNCSNEASLVAGCAENNGYENMLGGLIGALKDSRLTGEAYAEHLVIDRCRNNGNISLISTNVPCFAGGFVGFLSASKLEAHVSNSVNSGTVNTRSNAIWEKYDKFSETCGPSCAGGFFGFLDEDRSTSYFHNCLNKGSVEAYSDGNYARSGGFIGYSRENNNTSQDTDQDGSGDHVYAAMCVNTGSIIGHTKYVGSFCGTINGIKCVNCMWLDEHKYTEGVRAKLPYRPGLDDQAGGNSDSAHDDYYYSTIDTGTIAAAFKKMIEVRHCKYDNEKFHLRWGYIDGVNKDGGWKYWTAAWTGEAVWNSTNTLDIDFNSIINVDIDPSKL